MAKELWRPSREFISQSNLLDYEAWLGRNRQLYFDSYEALWEWSTYQIEDFWESIWQYFSIISYTPYTSVLSGDEMPFYRWFDGATLNYAEHIFRQSSDDRPALYFQNERGKKEFISWEQLKHNVTSIRSYLVEKGIGKGDFVVGFLPNIPEAIYIFLAANSLGAVWSCCSPDFGTNTVVERFSQINPRILFAVDGYTYNLKPYDKSDDIHEIVDHLPSLEETVIIPYLHPNSDKDKWTDILNDKSQGQLTFDAVPFSHPIWVLYSSGTTGKPKAITHSHGGMLLEHLKYMAFHNDVHPGENFFWFSTTGWMMWNFLQSSLLMGATAVLYDGSPNHPDLDVLWNIAEDLPIHHFGTSAPYLIACMKQKVNQDQGINLKKLRSIGSTGAPLPPETFSWIYEGLSEDVWLCSMSGGTDVCTAFVGGVPYKPVIKGHIQARALGCSLHAYDVSGQKMIDRLGEMVIDQPMPCMPIYFWNDPEHNRYKSSYFDTFPGKWRHGDFIHIYDDGSLMIHGRSDATLNRKGIRIGTAEIYNALDDMEEIKDALVLNLERKDGDDIMPLFVVLSEDVPLTDDLKSDIRNHLKKSCSPRHVPDTIQVVPDIPYTLSGKKMEVPVKKILMGIDDKNSINQDAIKNPQAILYFLDIELD